MKDKAMAGWSFPLGSKTVFVETNRQKKTRNFAKLVLRELSLPQDGGRVDELLYWLKPASCEIKSTSHGREYYEIYGAGFGGEGDFVDENTTIIIKLK